jgi:ABC-type phosphate/phosphonate transport system substrate-binding protein
VTIGLTSLLSPVSEHHLAGLVGHLRRTGLDVSLLGGSWDDRMWALRSGEAAGGWLCGLLHATLDGAGEWPFQVVAAPRSPRADDARRPVYHGDVVVRSGAPQQTFADLEGTTFAFNEEASLSGFHMMRHHLVGLGSDLTYFSRTIATGSHLASLQSVADGTADCAVVDSMLMDDGAADGLSLRTVISVGPYPAPPLVARPHVFDDLRSALAGNDVWSPVADGAYRGLRRAD